MRVLLLSLPIFLGLGCSTGSVIIDDSSGGGAGAGDDGGGEEGGGEDGGGGDEGGDEGGGEGGGEEGGGDDGGTAEPAWAGEWEGEMGLYAEEWDWVVCEGDMTVEIDENGDLRGEGYCKNKDGYFGDVEVELSGKDEDSDLEEATFEGGVYMVVSFDEGDLEMDADFEGEADDRDIFLEWEWTQRFGGGGGGQEVELYGWFEGKR